MVKNGEVDKLIKVVRETGIDMANLLDEPKNFAQTPAFFAATISNHELSLKMVQVLVDMGVNPIKEDLLKQTPLFYAAREGNTLVAQVLINKGINVNHQDKYGQTAIYYCVREGQIKMTQMLIDHGGQHDLPDQQNKRPIYYAIQQDKYDMVDFLLKKGVNLTMEDKKNFTPTHWAKKNNKKEILDLLLANGGVPLHDKKQPVPVKGAETEEASESKTKLNERKIPRGYVLTVLRDNGSYEPMTDAEFEQFRRENPQLAKYFELEEDQTDASPINSLPVPEVNEQVPIYDHWEKAAQRVINALWRINKSELFQAPVDIVACNVPDYFNYVKTPMDFGTIKTKLKDHRYNNIREFMADVELVFSNCLAYNGAESECGQISLTFSEEYKRLVEQLCLNFYMA